MRFPSHGSHSAQREQLERAIRESCCRTVSVMPSNASTQLTTPFAMRANFSIPGCYEDPLQARGAAFVTLQVSRRSVPISGVEHKTRDMVSSLIWA